MNQNYPKDSAGKLMTKNVPVVFLEETILEVEKNIFKNIKKLESINYVYVLSKNNSLKGVISIKELFRQKKSKKVSEVMVKELVVAHPYSDQERVSQLSLKHNIKAVPIVDSNNKFKGVVLSDDILDIVYKEAQEDIMHFAGINENSCVIDDVVKLSLKTSLKRRLPWLIVGLVGGLIVAWIIGLFEKTLAENIILTAFIPLVVYMASAVGTQVGFFIVRDLAINQKIDFLKYAWRHFRVIFFISLIVSILVFLIIVLFYQQITLAYVISLAMFTATLSSILSGLLIPYLISKMRFDPATVSGPIGTIIQDFLTVLIYLVIANVLL